MRSSERSKMYSSLGLPGFIIALVIVSIPLWILERYEGDKFALAYMAVVILAFITFNQSGLSKELSYFQGKMKGK